MSGFSLDNYRQPTAADVSVTLPSIRPRRENADTSPRLPKPAADAVEPQHGAEGELEHGGANNSGGDGAEQGSVEDIVERDEPDDGEHTDSTEEQVAAREAAEEEADEEIETPRPTPAPAPKPVVDVPYDDVDEDLAEQDEADEAVDDLPEPAPARQAPPTAATGTQPLEFVKPGGYNVGETELAVIKKIPASIITYLRQTLAPVAGASFAEQMSNSSLVVAFLMAKTGVQVEADPNTTAAAGVFRQADPRLMAVEQRLDEVLTNLDAVMTRQKYALKRVRETGDVVDGLEHSVAYLVGDRVARLTTADTDETNVDVTQRKVIVVRDRIRDKVKEQRRHEKDQAGRELRR